MELQAIIQELKENSDPGSLEGMKRFGIGVEKALGVRIPVLRKMAKRVGKDHELALALWDAGYRETRILAAMVDDPALVTEEQVDAWVRDFDSWEVCDQTCMNLFDKLTFAYEKAVELSGREREFEKRAGYALMACLAWHDKESGDERFQPFFKLIKRGATDERNYVKKAVNWALRQIGKRSQGLNKEAIKTAIEIKGIRILKMSLKIIRCDRSRRCLTSFFDRSKKLRAGRSQRPFRLCPPGPSIVCGIKILIQ